MDATPRIRWTPCDETPEAYRQRAFCSMSNLARALRLRQTPHWYERFIHGRTDVVDAPSEFGAGLMRRGQQYEALVWRALLHHVPHWRHCGIQARAAEMYVSQVDKPLVGCTDYILFRSLLEPPGERAVVEIKCVQRRQPPPERWGEQPPVDYLPQLEACMRSLHAHVAYLVVLSTFEQTPLPLRETDNVEDVGPPGVTALLHVWEVRRDDRWWQLWCEPRLRLLQQQRTAYAADPQTYKPTRYQSFDATRDSADALRSPKLSRLVLQVVWDGARWLPPKRHLLRPAHQLPIDCYMECSGAAAAAETPWTRACSAAPEDTAEESIDCLPKAIEEPAWMAALETATLPSDRSADTDSATLAH